MKSGKRSKEKPREHPGHPGLKDNGTDEKGRTYDVTQAG